MRSWHPSAFAFIFAVMAFTSSPVSAAAPIGSTVQATTTVSANGRTLRAASPLYMNDVLRSNATGVGQFLFDDGTKLAIGPSASVRIDKSIYKGKSVQRTSIQASKGAFRFISGKLSAKSIATPYGTIGIRGTAFDFTIFGGRLYLLLYRGQVSFCGGGGCKTLKRSCEYLVAGGGRITDPQPLSSGRDKGLNVAQAFPLLVNQGRLASQFRQKGKACLSMIVKNREIDLKSKAAALTTSEPAQNPPPGNPPPGGTGGKGNKGFGNGAESDDGSGALGESKNPGNGRGRGRNR